MAFLSKFKKVGSHLPHGTAKNSLSGVFVDKAERYVAAYAFGYIKGHYREKAFVRGMPVDVVAGVGALAGSVLLNVLSGGRSGLADHLERVGDAGVMSYLNTMGTAKGAMAAGRQTMTLPAGKATRQVVGAVPPIDAGATFLSSQQVRNFANRR